MSRSGIVLAGRTTVVTGAASGIGRALAVHAAKEGMAVAACDRDEAGLAALDRELRAAGAPSAIQVLDVSDTAALASFAQAVAELPPIALLFANAGILRSGDVLGMPIAQWRQLVDVNLIGVIATLQAFVPTMRDRGERAQVVVTGSTGSMIAAPGLAAYCATKHALWPAVEALRQELADSPVGVSLLMPGAVSTHIFDAVDPDRAPPLDSISPERVAAIAFSGALSDQPKILTHPDYIARAKERFSRTLDELSNP
ncbi:MAG: SDR family NAD(P)-dependent oxidoreductase [Sphingomonadales bacterium]